MHSNRFILVLGALVLASCASVYYAPDLAQQSARHSEIAFLPFQVTIQSTPRHVTVHQIEDLEEEMGYVFQQQIYTEFLMRSASYYVKFQDVAMTNSLLLKDSVTYDNLTSYTKSELASLLGVDAVVSGNILATQPMSTGGAIASQILLGYSGPTNQVDANVSLHNGRDSELMFQFSHSYSGGIGSSVERMTQEMMRQISQKFPYRNVYR